MVADKSVSLEGVAQEVAEEALSRVFPTGTDAKALNEGRLETLSRAESLVSAFEYSFRTSKRNPDYHENRFSVGEASIVLDASAAASVKTSLLRSFDEKLTDRYGRNGASPNSLLLSAKLLHGFVHELVKCVNRRSLPNVIALKDAVDYGKLGEWNKQEVILLYSESSRPIFMSDSL